VPGGRIELVSLTKHFNEVAVDNIDLQIASGEFFSLLGPSGCGKTTTLRLIAGFEQPTSGLILLDGQDVSAVPPHRRNVNTVFQSYALFPFLTVYDNVAFGLRNRKLAKAELDQRVYSALELVKLRQFEKRRPGQLSGGQQQRVALARALVLQPSVLLLDEPLGALDAKLRRSLKVELKALQEQVGITFLYVTHDQEEALTMSDRLAVMRDGKIVQIGEPTEVYERPADTYVADFLGVSNLMPVNVVSRGPGSRCEVRLGDIVLTAEHGGQEAPDQAHAVIRPERVQIEDYGSAGPNRVPAMVERLVYLGSATQVFLRLAAGCDVQVLMHNDGGPRQLTHGTPVHAYLAPDALRVLTGGAAVADLNAAAEDIRQASSQTEAPPAGHRTGAAVVPGPGNAGSRGPGHGDRRRRHSRHQTPSSAPPVRTG
jgi:spermidine/putrescine transport system ATP-binding protein